MIYGFAKQSAGHVKIYSELGHGTTVKLYLPRSRDTAQSGTQKDAAIPAESKLGETVLVVEDQQDVRELAAMMLSGAGYRILEAADGNAALALLEKRHDVDLIFIDLVMPGGMSGLEVAREALRCYPNIKVLFTSGYTKNALQHRGGLGNSRPMLSKPYKKGDLVRAVRCALDGGE